MNNWIWTEMYVNICLEFGAQGCKLWNFIFIHFHTFLLSIHYCTTGNEWKWMKMYEVYSLVPWGRGSISDRSISEEDQCRNFMCTKRTHDIRTLLPKNFAWSLFTIDDNLFWSAVYPLRFFVYFFKNVVFLSAILCLARDTSDKGLVELNKTILTRY